MKNANKVNIPLPPHSSLSFPKETIVTRFIYRDIFPNLIHNRMNMQSCRFIGMKTSSHICQLLTFPLVCFTKQKFLIFKMLYFEIFSDFEKCWKVSQRILFFPSARFPNVNILPHLLYHSVCTCVCVIFS